MIEIDEQQLLIDVQRIIDRASREGTAYCTIPRWMLEQLVEKATRPHD